MKQLSLLLASLVCALCLSACGGGGNDGGGSPSSPTAPTDPSSPGGDGGDGGSGGNGGGGSDNGSSPSNPPAPPDGGSGSDNGNGSGGDNNNGNGGTSPTTPQASWSTPAPIGGTGSQSAPAVTLDSQGRALALWMTSAGLGNKIWSSRYTPGQGWSVPAQVDGGNGSLNMSALPAQVVGNASGQALALWVQWAATGATSGNYALWARPYAPASGWGTAVQLTASLGNTLSSYSAGMDAQGRALVAWPQPDTSRGTQIAVASYAGAWSPAILLQPGPGVVTGGTVLNLYPRLAVTASGKAALAWQQTNMSQAALWVANYDPATGWSNITQAVADTPGTHDSGLPAVGMDASGRMTLAWGQLDRDASGNHAGIMARRYLPAGGWQAAQAVGTPVTETGALIPAPFLAVSEQGTAALVWSAPGTATLQASVAQAGGAWGAQRQLTAQLDAQAGVPQLAMDGSGNVTAAWVDVVTHAIVTSRYSGGAWSAPAAQSRSPSAWPALASNSAGTVALLWQTATSPTVQASFYTVGP